MELRSEELIALEQKLEMVVNTLDLDRPEGEEEELIEALITEISERVMREQTFH